MYYKSLKDTQLKISPTCFGSQRIHHQEVITFTLAETHTHTTGSELCRQTPTTHMINVCEPLQVISAKVQVITP